jgi:BASS family bile acid:Na+ symporter
MNVVTDVFLPISLAIIMFAMGLTLVVDDFKRVVVQPKDFLVGGLSQMILLPAVGFLLVMLWPMEPALAVGVMIIAACPGGVTSNILTHMARGDIALSISLTAVTSVLSVIALPFIVGFSIAYFLGADRAAEFSIGGTILGIFLITTVPVIIGMLVRRMAPATADRIERRARIFAIVLFLVIVFGAIYAERRNVVGYFEQAGPVTLALNLIMMAIAWALARGFRLGRRQGIAIVLECGLQNATVAIVVAGTLIGDSTMTIPGAIYGLLMYATGGLFVYAVARQPAAIGQSA